LDSFEEGMSEEPRQYWIRNDKGTTWGPLTFATIEVLLDNGALAGKLQASRDGLNFVFPGRLTEVRDAFPKDLWGDSSQPLEDAAATPAAPVRAPPTVGAPRPAPPTEESRPAAAPTPTPAPVPKPTAPSKPPPVPQPLAAGEGVPTSGDLSEFPPFRLYYLAATTNQTGRVTLNGTEASYEVFFKKGSPEAVRSSLEEEDLGAFLLGKGLLKPDQLAAARKMAPTTGGDLLNALFGMQLLSPGDAF
jgi:hypothetical protein